jgi:hypothetical protein
VWTCAPGRRAERASKGGGFKRAQLELTSRGSMKNWRTSSRKRVKKQKMSSGY